MSETNDTEISTPAQNQTQNTTSMAIPLLEEIHPRHPLYLHPSDGPGTFILSQKLVGAENYGFWSRSMLMFLETKHKQGFVLGTIKREDYDASLQPEWDRCNSMVRTWIMNSVSPNLASSIIYIKNASLV